MKPAPESGRRAQAARNDERILAAAREVFVSDPAAPVAAVADRAGVGISALYRRYGSKEELLRTLCANGLRLYIAEAEAALAAQGDPWAAYVRFMRRIVEADTHSLTLRLAGFFMPTEDLYRDTEKAQQLSEQLFERTRSAGAIRQDVGVVDVAMIFEQLSAIRVRDPARTAELRQRYLALALDGLRVKKRSVLPGGEPSWEEIGERWEP